jgi:hypothetical protein
VEYLVPDPLARAVRGKGALAGFDQWWVKPQARVGALKFLFSYLIADVEDRLEQGRGLL